MWPCQTPPWLASLPLLLGLQWCGGDAAPAPAVVEGTSVGLRSSDPVLYERGSRPSPKLFAIQDDNDARVPLLGVNFPDPSIVRDTDGTWYAFATASGNISVQVARADATVGPWHYVEQDLLPASLFSRSSSGAGTSAFTGSNTWAPDVRILGNGSYVMYFSGELANNAATHCIGAATSRSILGPWTPQPSALACPTSQGGAIDPSGFFDASTGRRYVVYKIDGNSIGNGGTCNNGVPPYEPTPLMLQEVSATDGYTPVGDPVELLDRTQEEDGPLIEAPNIVRIETDSAGGGTTAQYVLFYSSHCYSTPQYNVKYATADVIVGPYTRSGTPLIGTGDFNTTAPGGATSVGGGGYMVFHADCDAGRCMFGANVTVISTDITVN